MLNNKSKSKNIYIPENNFKNTKLKDRKPPMMNITSVGMIPEPLSKTSLMVDQPIREKRTIKYDDEKEDRKPPMMNITSIGMKPEPINLETLNNIENEDSVIYNLEDSKIITLDVVENNQDKLKNEINERKKADLQLEIKISNESVERVNTDAKSRIKIANESIKRAENNASLSIRISNKNAFNSEEKNKLYLKIIKLEEMIKLMS